LGAIATARFAWSRYSVAWLIGAGLTYPLGVITETLSSQQGARQMAVIPDKYQDLLQHKKAFANLATIMADGSPQVTPVWFDCADGVIRVNTAKGRVKSRTLRPGAPVALAIMDPDNAYRYIQIRGRVRRAVDAHRRAGEEIPRQRHLPVPSTRRGAGHVRD
jgi:PPOX class probable F420-dependent enzyme